LAFFRLLKESSVRRKARNPGKDGQLKRGSDCRFHKLGNELETKFWNEDQETFQLDWRASFCEENELEIRLDKSFGHNSLLVLACSAIELSTFRLLFPNPEIRHFEQVFDEEKERRFRKEISFLEILNCLLRNSPWIGRTYYH